MKARELTLLSVLILLISFGIYSYSSSNDIGDLGSLLGASCGLIAVLWFYRGLRLQSLQIEEQRRQFSRQHHLQYQDSTLSFLLTASERLESSYKQLIETLNLPDANQLASTYLKTMHHYKEALESTDPNSVMSRVQEWMKIEGPYVKFMSSVRDILILHQRRLGLDEKTDNIDVADFVFINSGHLSQQPFMSSYEGTIKLLSEQMMLLTPGRKAMIVASTTAMALLAPNKKMVKMEKISEDIEELRSKNIPLPKICGQIDC